MKPALIYTYDPLCCWSYGFLPIIEKLAARFEGRMELRVIPGGLAVDENAQSIKDGYPNLSATMKQVESMTDVTFGKNFRLIVEEGSYFFDSLPSCKAQTAVNRQYPDIGLRYASALQTALFRDGKDLNKAETFPELLEELNPDADLNRFRKLLRSPEIAQQTTEQFEWCRMSDASAFPTLLLEIGSETGLMSKGYRPYDVLESHLHHLIRNIERLSS